MKIVVEYCGMRGELADQTIVRQGMEIRINDSMRIDVADLEILSCNGISKE